MIVTQEPVAADVLALGTLDRVDYADRFTLTTDVVADPERWARALFGDTPTFGERFIWRGLLGIRLLPSPSRDCVAGWRIVARCDNWLGLAAASWFLSCNLVVQTGDGRVSLLTLQRYDRLPARIVWPMLAPVHRRLAPGLLRDAEAALR